MDRERKILEGISNRLGKGIYILIVLKKHGALLKEQIWKYANDYYKEKYPDAPQPLIKSRYTLDILTARLEGANLVDVREVGRSREYSRSEFAEELTQYMRSTKNH